MERCEYKECQNEATTKGFVLGRTTPEQKDNLFEVKACEKHKTVRGFFENKQEA